MKPNETLHPVIVAPVMRPAVRRACVLMLSASIGVLLSAFGGEPILQDVIVIPETGMTYRDFQIKCREIARKGDQDLIHVVHRGVRCSIAIPLTDKHASAPWYPYVLTDVAKCKATNRYSYFKHGLYAYLLCPGATTNAIQRDDVEATVRKLSAANGKLPRDGNGLSLCLVIRCVPQDQMGPIVDCIIRMRRLIDHRIVFLDEIDSPEPPTKTKLAPRLFPGETTN